MPPRRRVQATAKGSAHCKGFPSTITLKDTPVCCHTEESRPEGTQLTPTNRALPPGQTQPPPAAFGVDRGAGAGVAVVWATCWAARSRPLGPLMFEPSLTASTARRRVAGLRKCERPSSQRPVGSPPHGAAVGRSVLPPPGHHRAPGVTQKIHDAPPRCRGLASEPQGLRRDPATGLAPNPTGRLFAGSSCSRSVDFD